MELRGGADSESAAKGESLSSDNAAAATGEDRLSALPNDILVHILRRLDTVVAVRTSVLSHRWRRVWALLPELYFAFVDPQQIGRALEAHEAAIQLLFVCTDNATPDSLSAWLSVAARRLSGTLSFLLSFHNAQEGDEEEESDEEAAQEGDEEEAVQRGAIELPCLERATNVSPCLWFVSLAVPPAGIFARLTELFLSSVQLYGPGDLGDAVSWPRCPLLQKLTVRDTRGLDNVAIHSDSLCQVELTELHGLRQLNIVASALKDLEVHRCFVYNQGQLVANITAPQLATLRWSDLYDPSSVHLGEMRHLRLLRPFSFIVYGDDSSISTDNQSCLSLLRCFKVIEHLILTLTYLSNIDDYHYGMNDMTMLPDIMVLHLNVVTHRHAFGASAFHILRMCSGIKRLILSFEMKAQITCPPGCICGEHQNWETEHLLMNRLKEVEVTHMRGSEHEVTFLKQLFKWATSLEKMAVIFNVSVTESVAKELSQVLQSLAGPGICMKIHSFEDVGKVKGAYQIYRRGWVQ